jgi:hypothetical protein
VNEDERTHKDNEEGADEDRYEVIEVVHEPLVEDALVGRYALGEPGQGPAGLCREEIYEEEEAGFVLFPDAVAQPGAVMIVGCDAFVADLAMLGPQWLVNIALFAVPLLHIKDDLFIIIQIFLCLFSCLLMTLILPSATLLVLFLFFNDLELVCLAGRLRIRVCFPPLNILILLFFIINLDVQVVLNKTTRRYHR